MKSFWEIETEKERKGIKPWEGARLLMADLSLDKEGAKRIVPFGMSVGKNPKATMFIANYPKTSFSEPYREAALLVHVKTIFGEGVHCPWMIVDDDTALIYGRELAAFPKKMGEFTFEENENSITASVFRRGVTVFSMEATIGNPHQTVKPVIGRKIYNIGGPGQFFALNPIWMQRSVEDVKESYEAIVSVNIEYSEADPIKDIISGDPENGRFAVIDILNTKYFLPVGIAGPAWFGRTFRLRLT